MTNSNVPPINITIGASYGGINEAFARIAQSMEQFTGQMRQMANTMQQQLQESVSKSTEQLGELQKSLNITTLASAMQPAINALGRLKDKINETLDTAMNWSREVNSLSKTVGITTQEAGGLAKALQKLNVSTDTYRGAVFHLQRSLNSNEEALKRNGIATRDANGNMLNMQTIMMNTLDRLREMKPGYDANQLAMMAFGRGAKELEQVMKLTNDKIKEGADKVKALGIEVNAQSTSAIRKYKEAMFDVKDTLHALKVKIGQELMPVVADLAKSFASIAEVVLPTQSGNLV